MPELRGVRLLENCEPNGKRRRWQAAHQSQASRREVGRNGARHLHQGPNAASVRGWRLSHPSREEGAETPQTRKADLHTDVGYRIVPGGEKVLGDVQTPLDTKLVWRDAEDGLELADEMERRDLHLAGEFRDRTSGLAAVPARGRAPGTGVGILHVSAALVPSLMRVHSVWRSRPRMDQVRRLRYR